MRETGPLFKEERLRQEFWLLDPKAKYLMCKFNYVSIKRTGKPIIVTCIIYEGGSGVHSIKCKRGFDVRTEGYYTAEQIVWFEEHFNKNFPYDVNRPKMKTLNYHEANIDIIENGIKKRAKEHHLHCQVWIV